MKSSAEADFSTMITAIKAVEAKPIAPAERRRFSVRAGITCIWQVNGRNSIPFDQWMLLDLQYMDEWSLWLDLRIVAKTVPAVLRGSGAA